MGIANDWHELMFGLECLSKGNAKRQFRQAIKYSFGGLCAYCRSARATTLDHIKLQDEAGHTTHLGLTLFRLDGQANVNSFSVSKGSQITRMETHCFFAAPDAQAAMSAVYLGCDNQHHDITTVVSHEYADCK